MSETIDKGTHEKDVVKVPFVFRILSEKQKERLANLMLRAQKKKPKTKKRGTTPVKYMI